MLFVDRGSKGAEVPDVTGEAMASHESHKEALAIDEEVIAQPAPDTEQIEVDTVLGIVGNLP